MMNYLDDFVCGPTCEEYYDEEWVGWDDDFYHEWDEDDDYYGYCDDLEP